MTRTALFGWIVMIAGCVLWLYGYAVTGHPSLLDWQSFAPSWIADYLPNVEAEVGLLIAILAMVPMYWPKGKPASDS